MFLLGFVAFWAVLVLLFFAIIKWLPVIPAIICIITVLGLLCGVMELCGLGKNYYDFHD